MELKMKLATYEELPKTCRIVLAALDQPYYIIEGSDGLYVNKDMPGLQEVVAAMETMWKYDLAINEDVDNSYDTIVRVAGEKAANQIDREWHNAAHRSRNEKAELEAIEWVESVYKALDDDAWDEMCDAGYDSTFVEHGLYKATAGFGREHFKTWVKAAVVYGYQLCKSQQTA